jgi:predicted nucleic acid-binding protein
LTKNLFNRLIIVLPHALTVALPKPCVRWPRQDDGAASGSRVALVRVKPDKHHPVSAGRGRSCSTLLPGADRRFTAPRKTLVGSPNIWYTIAESKVRLMRIYLDNCCFNRPYDDQTQIKIEVETRAKLYIQSQVENGSLELVWSYMLDFENSQNIYTQKEEAISQWQTLCVADIDESSEIIAMGNAIQSTGVKAADALHVACAIHAACDYFITVDARLLKYKSDKVVICDPFEFLRIWEEQSHDA